MEISNEDGHTEARGQDYKDAKAVFDSITADQIKPPDDKNLLLHARAMREFLDSGFVDRL